MKTHRLWRYIVIVLGILAVFYIILMVTLRLLSMSPSGAVKVRIFEDYHPIIALKSAPYYDKDESESYHKTVYSISERYLSSDGSFTVTMFTIKKHNGKYIAYEQPDEV